MDTCISSALIPCIMFQILIGQCSFKFIYVHLERDAMVLSAGIRVRCAWSTQYSPNIHLKSAWDVMTLKKLSQNWFLCAGTVYPKKYAHGYCFAVLCCGYTLTDFPISIRLTSLALWQSNDCSSASKATLMNMDKYFMWIHYERLHNHNKAKHNKTVCIFRGIYCIALWQAVLSQGASPDWWFPRTKGHQCEVSLFDSSLYKLLSKQSICQWSVTK